MMAETPRVVVTDYIEADLEWEAEEMAKRGIEFAAHQLKFAPSEEVIAATKDATIVVVNMVKVTPDIVNAWNRCRLVIRHGAGYDNVDVPALTGRGILLEYVPDYCAHEVAEQAIALMLACARKVVWSRKVLDDSVARGAWDFQPLFPMRRFDGMTVGIVGCGRIGSLVYKKLEHFGVRLLVCDPYMRVERVGLVRAPLVSLKELLTESDFVTIHTPLNDETRHMINAETLSWMKPSAYLINTSRAGMVDHAALATALRDGQIAGAALDVFDKEPPATDFELLHMDNVILTPHVSWYSIDAERTIREKIVQTIAMFLDGTGPRYPVNPEVLQPRENTP